MTFCSFLVAPWIALLVRQGFAYCRGMTVQIIHGGQTGVDRGAHRGALAHGFAVGGFMPNDARDERGEIPEDVAEHLWRAPYPGLAARTKLNVESSHALIAVVADRTEPYATPGTKYTLECARRFDIKTRLVVDTETKPETIAAWAKQAVANAFARRQRLRLARVRHLHGVDFCLMIAGPRASLWPEGERVTMSLVGVLAAAIGSRA